MQEGKISIVVPVYNMDQYLNRCVESIFQQTYYDYEIILVDDGSVDRSGEICDELLLIDDRIRVIHQENKGVSSARNIGIDHACGEYIMFIDPDDYISPILLETLYDACKHYNVPLSQSMHLKTEKNSEDTPVFFKEDVVKIYCGAEPHWYLSGLSTGYVRCMVWATLYHCSLFKDIRFPVGISHEDEAVMHHLLYKAERMASIEAKLYFYYMNPEGFMKRKYNESRLDVMEVLYERVMFYRKIGWKGLEFVTFLRYYASVLDCYEKVRKNMKNNKEILGELKRKSATAHKELRMYSIADEKTISQFEYWSQNPQETPENIWSYAFEWVNMHPHVLQCY